MDCDGTGVLCRVVPPDGVHELIAREDVARMSAKELEQVELSRRQVDGRPVRLDLSRCGVERQTRQLDPSLAGALAVDRRRTLRTRAMSSRGENGLVR